MQLIGLQVTGYFKYVYVFESRKSAVGVQTGLAGQPRGRSSNSRRVTVFLLSTTFRPVLGMAQSPIQWVPWDKAAGS
jgi:hypothetical protein